MENFTSNSSSSHDGITQFQVDAVLGTVLAVTALSIIFVIWFRFIRKTDENENENENENQNQNENQNRNETNNDRVIPMNDFTRIPNPLYNQDTNTDNIQMNIVQPRYETISPTNDEVQFVMGDNNRIRSVIINDVDNHRTLETGV